MKDIKPDSINKDILYLFTLKTLINHTQTLLADIDLELDPTLFQAKDLDVMPELLGDLKATLGGIVQLSARLYLMDSPQD